MKGNIETALKDIDLYKCLNQNNYKYTPDDYGKVIQVIVSGNLFIIDNFLSSEECDNLIELAESSGFKEATVNIGGGRGKLIKDFRDCERVMIDDFKASSMIFERIQNILPLFNEGGMLSSVNERFRILKYNKDGKFETHYDGLFPRDLDEYSERSVFTLHIYLNEGSNGGETIFYHNKLFEGGEFKCIPKKGRIAIFRQTEFAHCGAVVDDGLKYTVRTDIMYRDVSENLFTKSCQLCKSDYQLYQCNGHKFPYCKCPNALNSCYYCVTCDKRVNATFE
jgi:prolyl 4-hydroxylase